MNKKTNRFTNTPINPDLDFGFDRELSIGLSEKLGVPSIAIGLSQFDLGIICTLNKDGYVYSEDVNKKAILSKYWDRNCEVINDMFASACSFEELIETAIRVLNCFINDMDDNTLNYLRNKAA